MSLTEEWKLGKKKLGHYYYKDKNGDECIARWWELNPAICVEILGKVPSYEHFAELSKTVEKLSSENQHLLNLNTKKEKMSLTEKWKKQMLEPGYYFFKEEKGSDVQVGFVTLEGDLVEPVRDIWFCSEYHPNLEIVAPCDYKEVQRLIIQFQQRKTASLLKTLIGIIGVTANAAKVYEMFLWRL